jgi:cell shape-determining protein MreC
MYDFRLDYIKELQQENASLRKKLKIANEETVKAQEIAKEVT